MAGKRRRLEVWLPEDHPVWELPEGQRAKVVRTILEAAFNRMVWPSSRLDERLARIEEALARLEEKLAGAVSSTNAPREEQLLDPDSFLAAFE